MRAVTTTFYQNHCMTLLTPVSRLQPLQGHAATFEWLRELDQLSFSWREPTGLSDSTPVDAEASLMVTKSRRAVIESFTELLSKGESREAGYASIFARIATSLPKESVVKEALNDALTVAVAALFLHDEAKQVVDDFNDKIVATLIEPVQETGQRLVEALERCAELSLAEFDREVMRPMIGFFAEVREHVDTIAQQAQRESVAFLKKSADIVDRTAAFVVSGISDAALLMIREATHATTKRVSAHLSAAAHEHQGFLKETAQIIEELIFRGDEAFKVA